VRPVRADGALTIKEAVCGFSPASSGTLNETANSETSAKMLMSKRFDVWLDGEALAQAALRKAGYQWGDVDVLQRLGRQDVYFAFSPGTPAATVQRWSGALLGMERDGSYQRMHRKWFPGAARPSHSGAWPKG
jgi:polar amino acid transport system substrate-binding protein